MKKYTIPFILAFTLSLILILLMDTSPSQALPNHQPTEIPINLPAPLTDTSIVTGRQASDGIISTSLLTIFGPQTCVAFGDPFSDLNSLWAPGSYTYQYRIEIPADYPSDILRVEIFDPDSMNNVVTNTDTVPRTDAAQAVSSLPPFEDLSCIPTNTGHPQKWPCLIDTGEVISNTGAVVGELSLDQVNPYWFLRVDENWGRNDGLCTVFRNDYLEEVNTKTLFALSYDQQETNGAIQKTFLTSYTGQIGTEAINHETDLHWVSPGANVSFGWDKDGPGVEVPVDPGSQTANGFEINLTTELPNIVVDPKTGNRYLHLEVTALSGSAENTFDLWAGPPDYVNSVPSNVNQRNLYILNNPGSHNSQGVSIYALDFLSQNVNSSFPTEIPLTTISPEQAGETVKISLYDADAGSLPPVTFYFDTIAKEDWSVTFADTSKTHDPDGITTTVRCIPGECHTEWIEPAYEIQLPNGTKDCNFNDPTGNSCIPFYGGQLMATYQGGKQDTYVWQVSTPEKHPAPYAGCDAFPIAIHEGIRSVTPPGEGGNPYPDTTDFTGPTSPRTYDSFIHHQDDVPLLQAKEGTVFKVPNGFGAGEFGWLRWNEGIQSSANTLQDSLTWPGNIFDYTDHGDSGAILLGQTHVVRGFIEAGDASDTELHVGDWIATSTGSINSAGIRSVLNEHSELERTLRLPIWDTTEGSGMSGRYKASAFALFRFHGYSFSPSSGNWILLEFLRFDQSCGQPSTSLRRVEVEGVNRAKLTESITLTANISPTEATQPISYTWEATNFAPITQGSGISDTITFNWSITGTKTITVTAVNPVSTVTQTHTINVTNLADGQDLTIVGTPQLITPLPIEEGKPVEFAVIVKNLGDTAVSSQAFINLFVNPSTMHPDGIPPEQSAGFSILFDLDPGASKTINVTLPDGLTKPNSAHQIYAMVDTFKSIDEVDESNNVSEPLTFNASSFAEQKFIYLPMIIRN